MSRSHEIFLPPEKRSPGIFCGDQICPIRLVCKSILANSFTTHLTHRYKLHTQGTLNGDTINNIKVHIKGFIPPFFLLNMELVCCYIILFYFSFCSMKYLQTLKIFFSSIAFSLLVFFSELPLK